MPSAEPTPKRDTLNLRIKPEVRGLIDRAAKVRGKNRTDFILEAAQLAAEEALLDQSLICVSPETYAEFVARLDCQPAANPRLQKTLQTTAPWDPV
ncbi:MAG: DUF1778 domain-containing protein [Nitrincola lacisaponensis]|uniref:CopG family transcriptional regulator n=1 Tax=Nitrincola lacisaponensis TaxID=267850 RepID=A0A063Y5J1_9GAMM|nr:DUF1778 domain-containing protein [Nitrincola lacisaponensis]KDE40016.1 hypothetical protein ADINL_1653 [Nitrincola lacisaponensis]